VCSLSIARWKSIHLYLGIDMSGYPEVTIHLSLWTMHKLFLFEIQLYVDQAG
jgi:hypothetical protein